MLNLTGVIVVEARYIPSGKIVLLDTPHQGRKYAVINAETRGRAEFYKRLGSKQVVGSRVTIVEAEVGSEALLATQIEHPN